MPRRDPSRPQPAELREGLLVEVVERQVFGEGELKDEAAPLAILGDVAEARVVSAMCVRGCDVPACDLDGAAARLAEAGEGLDELALAVPVDTCERDDLPRPHVEETPRTASRSRSSSTCRFSTRRRGSPGSTGGFSTLSRTSRPTIRRASPCGVAPSRGTVSIFLPRRRTVMRSAIASTSRSL